MCLFLESSYISKNLIDAFIELISNTNIVNNSACQAYTFHIENMTSMSLNGGATTCMYMISENGFLRLPTRDMSKILWKY